MEEELVLLGQRIKKRRLELNMNQMELAEKTEISNNHLSNIEAGRVNIKYDVLVRLCAAMNVSPDYLMLGAMHSNNLSLDVTDMMRTLGERKLKIARAFIEMLRDLKI